MLLTEFIKESQEFIEDRSILEQLFAVADKIRKEYTKLIGQDCIYERYYLKDSIKDVQVFTRENREDLYEVKIDHFNRQANVVLSMSLNGPAHSYKGMGICIRGDKHDLAANQKWVDNYYETFKKIHKNTEIIDPRMWELVDGLIEAGHTVECWLNQGGSINSTPFEKGDKVKLSQTETTYIKVKVTGKTKAEGRYSYEPLTDNGVFFTNMERALRDANRLNNLKKMDKDNAKLCKEFTMDRYKLERKIEKYIKEFSRIHRVDVRRYNNDFSRDVLDFIVHGPDGPQSVMFMEIPASDEWVNSIDHVEYKYGGLVKTAPFTYKDHKKMMDEFDKELREYISGRFRQLDNHYNRKYI